MKLSLMFFAASEESHSGGKYQLLLESARFADRNGFSSVWVPERHFSRLGSLYPNPAVLQAALAAVTERIGLRAGSVVAPLHHPVRIAEEWSVVDNLSGGRVGVSFAPGWNPADFAFFPERYPARYDHVASAIETVRKLWRGERVAATDGTGQPIEIGLYPAPIQPEFPLWLTAAGSEQAYIRAGALGAHLLTHLLDQGEEELARKIRLYRDARGQAGFDPATGEVSVMLHSFVGADAGEVREQARAPYCRYLMDNIGLLGGLARSRGQAIDPRSLRPEDLAEFAGFLYDRFAASRGLIGTPECCLPLAGRLEAIGVTEIACLLDFGPSVEQILANLPHLARLRALVEQPALAQSPNLPLPNILPLANVTTEVGQTPASIQARCQEQPIPERSATGPGRLRKLWVGTGEALGLQWLNPVPEENALPGFPETLLDSCEWLLRQALAQPGGTEQDYRVSGFDRWHVTAEPREEVWLHAQALPRDPADTCAAGGADLGGDVHVYSASGEMLARLEGLRFERIEHRDADARAQESEESRGRVPLYRRIWEPVPDRYAALGRAREPQSRHSGNWHLVVCESPGAEHISGEGGPSELATQIAAHVAEEIREAGGNCRVVRTTSLLSEPPKTPASEAAGSGNIVFLGHSGEALLEMM